MKVFLLGSTGRLGNEILKRLIGNKIETNILVRNRDKIKLDSEYLKIFVGNPLNKEKLEHSIAGCSVIINALNISRQSDFPWSKLRAPKTLLSQTISNFIDLSSKYEFKKIISVSAWGVKESKNQLPFWFRWLIDFSNIKYGYLDHEKQEELLTESNFNWLIVRPVGLNNSKRDKQPNVSINSKPKNIMVSRRTVSKFITNNLKIKSYSREIVVIS
jgi:putative NADH-flavin reductase